MRAGLVNFRMHVAPPTFRACSGRAKGPARSPPFRRTEKQALAFAASSSWSTNEQGPPGGGPCPGAWERARKPRPGGTKPGLPLLAGARGGFRRAPEPVRRLAALHLQSPLKHVTQNRTTSFLW